MSQPQQKPVNPFFSSGPCKKRPGWNISNLSTEALGRSHRAKNAKSKLNLIIEKSKIILNLPKDYKVGIVAGSDTGAIEAAMWSMLGERKVEILGWENFGYDWIIDVKEQLKLENLIVHKTDYGILPDLKKINFENDIIFNWNGTSSGVCVPDGEWISKDRKGLTFCDATSAVFAMKMDFKKLDVITWSWQKVLGGEAAHGMIALSPKALNRLTSYEPPWPIPKIFRLANRKKVSEGVFKGETINTPSMLCAEDVLDSLNWIESIGGEEEAIKRSKKNLQVVKDWLKNKNWIDFLAKDQNTISSTSICLKILDPTFIKLSGEDQKTKLKKMNELLENENVAYDINSYRTAPPGFRIWGGATVESDDIANLLPWIEWAYTVIHK
ncbi:MAG: phosphoserine transaminase [Candidatus Pelagibacter sp.]|nr:phosphoserine transaminase [Candidatus Pelagibacter sp.]|tara:strand:- start:9258 stop:10406 length:1149 start_codon:yes stop_codon:yes gene_type:complete